MDNVTDVTIKYYVEVSGFTFPMQQANVYLGERSLAVDSNGICVFKDVPFGKYTLTNGADLTKEVIVTEEDNYFELINKT